MKSLSARVATLEVPPALHAGCSPCKEAASKNVWPTLPASEAFPMAALRHYPVLDTQPEPPFDRIADLARALFDAPAATVSFVDETRQWFKVRRGLEESETPSDLALCSSTILSDEPLVVPDARRDPRFVGNPLVTGGPRIRFYAGAPIIVAGALRLGTVCIASPQPRAAQKDDVARLAALAAMMGELLNSRLHSLMLAEAATERSAALARAEALAAERDQLAREADHRKRGAEILLDRR